MKRREFIAALSRGGKRLLETNIPSLDICQFAQANAGAIADRIEARAALKAQAWEK
jgi:hypothetical protein